MNRKHLGLYRQADCGLICPYWTERECVKLRRKTTKPADDCPFYGVSK